VIILVTSLWIQPKCDTIHLTEKSSIVCLITEYDSLKYQYRNLWNSIYDFSSSFRQICFFKQLPPFPCRFNFCNTPLLQEVQAPGLKFIWEKHFSMFFSLPRLYLTLATIKTSEFSTLGRCILKRVRFRYKNVCDKSFEKTLWSSLHPGSYIIKKTKLSNRRFRPLAS
jgi:hypothetical protein